MKKAIISILLTVSLLVGIASTCFSIFATSESTMRVGVGKADITGPITRISTGYNSLGDLMDGLLTRLNARAFIIESNGTPVVYVSAELVHMTESIKPAVLKELQDRGLTRYTEENVMLTATHCHSSSSNVSWYALYDLINGVPGYDDASYQLIVKGIADAIEAADKDLAPGSIVLSYANTDIESYNRSLYAAKWNVNYDESKYKNDFDAVSKTVNKEMEVLRFIQDGKDVGMLSFFASHGTSNGIDNTLIASDHKGYACYYVEQAMGDGYVAANCQTESGDVSPNRPQESDVKLAFQRPADIDENLDVIENQIVAGQQEADAMLRILKGGAGVTSIDLSDSVQYNYSTVDFSDISVDEKYIGEYKMPYDDVKNAKTSEPCIGAGIIAGDEEGAPVDNAEEGSVRHDFKLNDDGTVTRTEYDFSTIDLSGLEKLFKPLWPTAMKILQSDGYDDEQMEKVVCLAVGKLMQKQQPVQILKIGELAIAGVSFEVSTEQGARTKAVLEDTLSKLGVEKVILATHANAYSQYITTREEYAAQHYEGATNLFGPWSGSAMTQELDRLAQDMVNGKTSDKGPGLRNSKPLVLLQTPASFLKPGKDTNDYGTLVTDVDTEKAYSNGDTVTAVFNGTNPRHVTNLRLAENTELVPDDYTYMEVQKLIDGKWVTVRNDADPYTTFRYSPYTAKTATLTWLLRDVDDGTYRFAYNGIAKTGTDSYEAFTSYSSEFTVGNAVKDTKPAETTPDKTDTNDKNTGDNNTSLLPDLDIDSAMDWIKDALGKGDSNTSSSSNASSSLDTSSASSSADSKETEEVLEMVDIINDATGVDNASVINSSDLTPLASVDLANAGAESIAQTGDSMVAPFVSLVSFGSAAVLATLKIKSKKDN